MKLLKLLFSMVTLFAGASIIGAPVAEFLDISHGAATAGLAGLSLAVSPLMSAHSGLFAATLTITDIITEYGDYFQNRGQTEDNIKQLIKEKRQLSDYAQLRVIDGDIYELSKAEVSGIIQTFKKNWSPGNAATFTPNPIRTRNVKIDLELYPDEVKSAWLGFFASLKEGDRKNWTFVKWYWEVLVAPQLGKDMSLVDWAGNHVDATNDTTPGTTKGSYDGLRHQIIADKALGGSAKMNNLALSTHMSTASTAFDTIESAARAIPQEWLQEDVLFITSARAELDYFRDKRNTHGADTNYNGAAKGMSVDGRPNWKIVPLLGMDQESDHDWLVITPAKNLFEVRRGTQMNLHMESARRCVSVMGDFYTAFGFGLKEMVYYDAQYFSS